MKSWNIFIQSIFQMLKSTDSCIFFRPPFDGNWIKVRNASEILSFLKQVNSIRWTWLFPTIPHFVFFFTVSQPPPPPPTDSLLFRKTTPFVHFPHLFYPHPRPPPSIVLIFCSCSPSSCSIFFLLERRKKDLSTPLSLQLPPRWVLDDKCATHGSCQCQMKLFLRPLQLLFSNSIIFHCLAE